MYTGDSGVEKDNAMRAVSHLRPAVGEFRRNREGVPGTLLFSMWWSGGRALGMGWSAPWKRHNTGTRRREERGSLSSPELYFVTCAPGDDETPPRFFLFRRRTPPPPFSSLRAEREMKKQTQLCRWEGCRRPRPVSDEADDSSSSSSVKRSRRDLPDVHGEVVGGGGSDDFCIAPRVADKCFVMRHIAEFVCPAKNPSSSEEKTSAPLILDVADLARVLANDPFHTIVDTAGKKHDAVLRRSTVLGSVFLRRYIQGVPFHTSPSGRTSERGADWDTLRQVMGLTPRTRWPVAGGKGTGVNLSFHIATVVSSTVVALGNIHGRARVSAEERGDRYLEVLKMLLCVSKQQEAAGAPILWEACHVGQTPVFMRKWRVVVEKICAAAAAAAKSSHLDAKELREELQKEFDATVVPLYRPRRAVAGDVVLFHGDFKWMLDWCVKAGARDAVEYLLRMLCESCARDVDEDDDPRDPAPFPASSVTPRGEAVVRVREWIREGRPSDEIICNGPIFRVDQNAVPLRGAASWHSLFHCLFMEGDEGKFVDYAHLFLCAWSRGGLAVAAASDMQRRDFDGVGYFGGLPVDMVDRITSNESAEWNLATRWFRALLVLFVGTPAFECMGGLRLTPSAPFRIGPRCLELDDLPFSTLQLKEEVVSMLAFLWRTASDIDEEDAFPPDDVLPCPFDKELLRKVVEEGGGSTAMAVAEVLAVGRPTEGNVLWLHPVLRALFSGLSTAEDVGSEDAHTEEVVVVEEGGVATTMVRD